MTPTDELRSALVWAEYYAHARFITQCFPTATSIERREGDLSDIEYVIRSADSDLFRFAGSDSIDYDSDLFALDLQDLIEKHTRSGVFYEKAIRSARQDLVDRLGLPGWATVAALFEACKMIVDPQDIEYPLDIQFLATAEMSALEQKATELMHSIYETPYPVLGRAADWLDSHPFR